MELDPWPVAACLSLRRSKSLRKKIKYQMAQQLESFLLFFFFTPLFIHGGTS